jgi:uncharacterized protein (TIGR03435 family)
MEAQRAAAAIGKPLSEVAAGSCQVMYWLDGPVGRIRAGGATLDAIAKQLRYAVGGRPVKNETNLSGTYSIDLRYSAALDRDGLPAADAPGIHEALRDQLGLKVQSSTTQVDILVIDHVERPKESEN